MVTPATGGTGSTGTGTTTATKPRSFHGSIQIKPSAAKMHLVQVAEEIIALLAGTNDELIKQVAQIYVDDGDTIADVTYGRRAA
jgi:uncharacterized protein